MTYHLRLLHFSLISALSSSPFFYMFDILIIPFISCKLNCNSPQSVILYAKMYRCMWLFPWLISKQHHGHGTRASSIGACIHNEEDEFDTEEMQDIVQTIEQDFILQQPQVPIRPTSSSTTNMGLGFCCPNDVASARSRGRRSSSRPWS